MGREIAVATESLSVPGFDLAAIRSSASREAPASDTLRPRLWWLAVGILAVPCFVAAATIFPSAAVRNAIAHQMLAWTGVRAPSSATQTITFMRLEPTSIEDAVKSAHFRLLLPKGLPAGWKLRALSTDGTGRSYSAEYQTPSAKIVAVSLAEAVPHARYVPWVGRFDGAGDTVTNVARIPTRVWIVGDEKITVEAAALTQSQAAAVLHATHARPASLVR